VRRSFAEWWHGLPWNGLFWLLTLSQLGFAAFFATQAELDLAAVIGVADDAPLAIQSGDLVRVELVLNGDEVVIERDARRARLRMIGIRSFDPVVNEREITAFGNASVNFLEQWVLHQEVTVMLGGTQRDVHGRYLGVLVRGDVDVNRRMVEEGISMVYTEYATDMESVYLSTEIAARSARRGIWGVKKATARILGLRQQWSSLRQQRTGHAPIDPMLMDGGR
jgi:endonuclease YncB( thermonuclease family)